jgi:hypothetical protein
MLKELFSALVCGFAIAGQMRAQEVVVAREAKPNPSERVARFSEGTGSESEAATEMKSQRREKKSVSATLTLEQMRMGGALAAERQKKQTPASELHLTSRDQETKKDTAQVIAKEKTAKGIRPVAHYSYTTPAGKKESAPVITQYYPKQIIYPFAKIDRHIDGKLMQAATIAQERAHAHSRSMCWHYVKEALLASGVINSRPKSELAKDAAQDLVSNYGFKKLSVTDPFAAPVGSVLVYGANRAAGHVEIRTRDGFVSDFCSKTPSPRPLLGVYAKL